MSRKVRLSPGEFKAAVQAGFRHSLIESAGWRMPRDADAENAFDELVEKGCDSIFLASRLAILKDAHRFDTWDGLTGFADPDTLRTALKRLRVCAQDVDRLLGAVIGRALLQDSSAHTLATHLRDVADRVEKAVQVITPSRNLTGRAARADIVRHVEDRTGSPRDVLVAAVLDPALGCDAGTQKQWRYENRRIIRAVSPK
jgi:hypothetical protein